MEKKQFARRMSQLRQAKGVSARDMSLSLGHDLGFFLIVHRHLQP